MDSSDDDDDLSQIGPPAKKLKPMNEVPKTQGSVKEDVTNIPISEETIKSTSSVVSLAPCSSSSSSPSPSTVSLEKVDSVCDPKVTIEEEKESQNHSIRNQSESETPANPAEEEKSTNENHSEGNNQKILTRSESSSRNIFLISARILCMKIRAYYILKDYGISPFDEPSSGILTGQNKNDLTPNASKLSFFPDEILNGLMTKVLSVDVEFERLVLSTICVFWHVDELEKRKLPREYPYDGGSGCPIVPGCDVFFNFWDVIYDYSTSSDRERRLKRAIKNSQSKIKRLRDNK